MPAISESNDLNGLHYHYIEGAVPKTSRFPAFYRMEMCAEDKEHPEFGRRVVLKVMPMGGLFNFCRIVTNIWTTSFDVEQDEWLSKDEAMAWVARMRVWDVDLNSRHED